MRDGVVKRLRRGGSRPADGCLITRLAIWAALTQPKVCMLCVCVRACAVSRADARIYKDANGSIAREANTGI